MSTSPRRRVSPRRTWIVVAGLALAAPAGGQPAFPPAVVPPELRASRVTSPPAVDGRLDDDAWSTAAVASAFVQAEPRQGEPATDRTEVRVIFDDRHLYVGVVCADAGGADDLRVRDLRRDFDETTDDFFGIAIDGVQDGRSAMVFRVNPRGALRDQQTVDGGLADVDFDAVWSARTVRDSHGWSAELAIPWSTLRYRADGGTWNVNFQRLQRRRNESSGWSPWPRVMQPFRMDYAGRLTGLEPPPPSRNLRVQPYMLGDASHTGGAGGTRRNERVEAGTDLKWAMTPNAVLDLTLHPDFGHTDVDRQVVNLTRFNVFFPERRQFFLENRGVFFTGNSGRFEPFFSRRIGLDDAGGPIPIHAGARLSMRSAGHAFGALAVSQGGDGTDSEFGVIRYVKNFSGQNRLGGIVAARHERGGESNVVAGVDGFWRMSSTAFVRGTVTRSATTGRGGEGVGGYVWIANDTNRGYFGYISELVTAGYDARSGFVVRQDYLRISPAITLDWRPHWRPRAVRRFQPGFTFEHVLDPNSGATQEGFVSLRPLALQLENGGMVQYAVLPHWQRLRAPFRPVPGVSVAPGRYDYLRHAVTIQTDPSARLAARVEGQTGGYFDGALQTWRGVLQATPDPRLALSADYTVNRLSRVGAPAVTLTTHLLGVETRVATTPRLQLVGFVQWNTAARQLTANARLAWEYRPLSFFTIVYNDRSPVDGRGAVTPAPFSARQLLVKLTWLSQI